MSTSATLRGSQTDRQTLTPTSGGGDDDKKDDSKTNGGASAAAPSAGSAANKDSAAAGSPVALGAAVAGVAAGMAAVFL